MHTAPANSAMFISQVTFFCFELSLGRGAALRCNICFLNRARRGDTWLAMRKLPPAPVPYAKALPAPVATWLAMRKLPLSQWGAVRVTHNHSAIAITSSGVGARHKNMSNMVLGKVPAARTNLVRNMVLGPVPAARPRGLSKVDWW